MNYFQNYVITKTYFNPFHIKIPAHKQKLMDRKQLLVGHANNKRGVTQVRGCVRTVLRKCQDTLPRGTPLNSFLLNKFLLL